jgi:hypothetical protein
MRMLLNPTPKDRMLDRQGRPYFLWDGGFSPLVFAWTLRELPIAKLADALGRPKESAVTLERFRDELVERVLALAVLG